MLGIIPPHSPTISNLRDSWGGKNWQYDSYNVFQQKKKNKLCNGSEMNQTWSKMNKEKFLDESWKIIWTVYDDDDDGSK